MRRPGIGVVVVLVILSVIFGAIAGAVVSAIVLATSTTSVAQGQPSTPAIPEPSSLSSEEKITPVTSAVGVVKHVGPAVVEIIHQLPSTTDAFGQIQSGGVAIGSGFIIDTSGDIVTNNHVIAGGNPHYTVVYADGKQVPATLVGANPGNDIAVIKVSRPVPAVAQFGNSNTLQPGEPVVAIGDALGEFQNTVTEGIVSGLHRSLPGVVSQDMIQTDAAINHGNSGGPLVDLAGQVVGIDTAIERSTGEQTSPSVNPFSSCFPFCSGSSDPNETVAEGLGFAIPSNTAGPLAWHIIRHVPPPYLGVRYSPVPGAQEAEGIPAGARVAQVKPGSPAQKAGVRASDVIIGVGRVAVNNTISLEQAIVPLNPGTKVTIRVWRPHNPSSTRGQVLSLRTTLTASSTQQG